MDDTIDRQLQRINHLLVACRDAYAREREVLTFHATFAFEDRAEGMSAFADKRKATWKHR